jgi:D-alanyl-lipoteichoic acid acyltransferase DltB (MBOAT superfamily)
MTLGTWIRDYLFLPMYKPIASGWPRRAPSLVFGCYFAAFALAGLWHGATMNFLIYGLLQGAGAAAAKLWENRLVARGGRSALREYGKSARIRLAAVAVHLHYQCFALLFFSATVPETLDVLRNALAVMGGGRYP